MLKLLESKIVFFGACIIFRVLLDLAYSLFVNPLFSYSGFEYDLSVISYSSSWFFYISALMVTPHLLRMISDYFIASFLLTVIAPLSSIFGLSGIGIFPLFVTVSVFMFFKVFQYGSIASKVLPVPRIKKITEGRALSLNIALLSVMILVSWYFYSGAFRYFNLNLLKVYDFREASAELARVGFFRYFNGWVYKVFSIFLMCYFLFRKRYLFFITFLGVQIFFFGVSAHKAVLFYPLMIFGMWFYFRRTQAMSVVPIGFSFIVLSCLALYLSFEHTAAGSLFIRRVFFIPAKLTLDYFSFFSINEFVWWSNSVLESFISYPYDLSIPKEIGRYNGNTSSANNGFVSSGYGHGGLWGVAIYTLIFAYFLKVLDSVVLDSDMPVWLALCMTIVPLRSALIASDLFTVMLTHGLALSLIMVLLFRRSRYSQESCDYHNA